MSSNDAVRVEDTKIFVSDVIGEEVNRGKRVSTGEILRTADLLAGAIAGVHAQGPVATIAFNRVDIRAAVSHGDHLWIEGKVIKVGSSSMVLEILCFKVDMYTKQKELTLRTQVTMVAIDSETLRPRKGIRKVAYGDGGDEEQSLEFFEKWKVAQSKWEAISANLQQQLDEKTFSAKNVEAVEPNREGKHVFVPIGETEIVFRRQFLPRNLNSNETIFGGDFLYWLDKCALCCARHFTGIPNVMSKTMNRIVFRQPIFAKEIVECRARVVYVRHHSVQVKLDVYKSDGGEWTLSHTGKFNVIALDDLGARRRIAVGLDLENATQEELCDYAEADAEFEFFVKHKDVFEDRFGVKEGKKLIAKL